MSVEIEEFSLREPRPRAWHLSCGRCDRPVEEEDAYCCSCGACLDRRVQVLVRQCPGCLSALRASGRYCPHCGRAVSVVPEAERTPLSWLQKTGPERYRLLASIGRGGMSEAFKAEDLKSGEIVCLKRLNAGVDVRVLEREGRALAQLQHPGIVTIRDMDLAATPPILVMEFITGRLLADFAREHGPAPEGEATDLVAQLFDAVAYAHSRGIVHRDLKPGNVILEVRDGRPAPKILDFGIALLVRHDHESRITAMGNIVGTPIYMAPEQIAGETLTESCDVYALGLMFWELLAGRPPFDGPPYQVMERKMSLPDGLDIRDDVPGVSDAAAALIRACTKRDPGARPSARDALAMLRGVGADADGVADTALATATFQHT